jgi:ATP-binding cassette subfamily B protein
MATVIALILYTGARNAFSSLHISLGTLTAFVLLFKRFFDPIMSIGEEWQTVQSALSGLERIFEVMDTPCEPDCTTPQPTNKKHSTGIEFNHVTFGYSPKRAVLQDISFQVAEGEHVALIGRTGAGKSSILNLVSGLYAPWDGNIRVAGYDPRQLIEGQRRKVIGVVPQKIQLFSGTILENLTLGDTSIPVDVVQKAAQLTGADGFICSFKQGYETQIGGNRGQGVRLSVGQRQLLSLTRALVWDPPILLFDEATSAIDSASEAAFRESLRNQAARQGHTILTVAHRLATAREADRLIVLGQGRILEVGTPRELERLKGAYAALLALEQGDAPKVSREGLAKAA